MPRKPVTKVTYKMNVSDMKKQPKMVKVVATFTLIPQGDDHKVQDREYLNDIASSVDSSLIDTFDSEEYIIAKDGTVTAEIVK